MKMTLSEADMFKVYLINNSCFTASHEHTGISLAKSASRVFQLKKIEKKYHLRQSWEEKADFKDFQDLLFFMELFSPAEKTY